jgi:hypothetical protein
MYRTQFYLGTRLVSLLYAHRAEILNSWHAQLAMHPNPDPSGLMQDVTTVLSRSLTAILYSLSNALHQCRLHALHLYISQPTRTAFTTHIPNANIHSLTVHPTDQSLHPRNPLAQPSQRTSQTTSYTHPAFLPFNALSKPWQHAPNRITA